MYDLTSFLTAVASSAACIVAILGGFIASKLISIDGERDSILSRLKDIEEELAYRGKIKDTAQRENDEDDALDFIEKHFKELQGGASLTEIYATIPEPDFPIEKMQPYWQRAIAVSSAFQSKIEHFNGEKLNADYVPESLYCSYHESSLEYQICKLLGNDLHVKCSQNGYPYIAMNTVLPLRISNGYEYRDNQQKISEQNAAISLLGMQAKNLKAQIPSLKKPKGVKAGLVIFALFSMGCIIVPLALSPFTTDNLLCYNLTKWIVLIVFFFGLSSIFAYLIYLLRWNRK